MAINGYLLMFVGALVWLIRRQHVSVLAAKAAAPVGMVMTLIALVTGAIWGQPMWGTYWVWDPRLTSFLILFLFYVGYIALWAAIEDEDTAADLTSVLAIVGAVFAMLSRYAVLFWNPVAFLLHSFRQALLWQQAPDLSHLMGLTLFLSCGLVLVAKGMSRYRYYLAQRVVTT